MRISDWSSDVCSSDLAVAEGEAVAAGELRRPLGGAGELVDHLAFGHGDLADLDGEAEFLRHELHRHLAEADLSGEGMVAPVAALRRVAERQKEALVTAREVLQAQVAPGREAQWLARQVADRHLVVQCDLLLDEALVVEDVDRKSTRLNSSH